MSGLIGIMLQLSMGASLTVGANLNAGGDLQDHVNREKQDSYFREVLPQVISYDPNNSFKVGFDDNHVPFHYYSASLENLIFANQALSRIQYKVLEIRDKARNDVSKVKQLESVDAMDNKIHFKVGEDVPYSDLKYARFRLSMVLPVGLKRTTIPLAEDSHIFGKMTVKVSNITKDHKTSNLTIKDKTVAEERPTTTISYSYDQSASGEAKQAYLLGLSGYEYTPISKSWESSVEGIKTYHVTFNGEPRELELIELVSTENFIYNMILDFKTGKTKIEH